MAEMIHGEKERKRGSEQMNLTGIPTQLKQSFENRSGFSFDNVRVHYNSGSPARLGALAYTQGDQVYIGPGQEQHLPHELGHVVQQKQGLVQANGSVRGQPLNDDPVLERGASELARSVFAGMGAPVQRSAASSPGSVVQRIGTPEAAADTL